MEVAEVAVGIGLTRTGAMSRGWAESLGRIHRHDGSRPRAAGALSA